MVSTEVTTKDRLVSAAAALLDAEGEKAVTLRAVGHGAGVSHNAPYKHFRNRDALLAAVATADFEMLADRFEEFHRASQPPLSRLKAALEFVISFSHKRPSRYHLLFSNPAISSAEGEVRQSAMRAFSAFACLVEACQESGDLPAVPHTTLSGIVFASLHGLLAFEANGQMHPDKGFIGVGPSVDLLIELISTDHPPPSA